MIVNESINRIEFDALDGRVEKLEESHERVLHLVAGGMNAETGRVDKGIVQALDDLVCRLDTLGAQVQSSFAGFRKAVSWVLRSTLYSCGAGLFSILCWVLHQAWPSIVHFFLPP